jgi:hypothetical protein
MSALALVVAMVCSFVSSVLVPGGIVTRLLGLAVVGDDGREIGRSRSFVRVILAWLPVLVWGGWLLASPKLQGWVPAPRAPLLSAGLALAVLGVGACWTVVRPWRGPHDRVAGTWVVPR